MNASDLYYTLYNSIITNSRTNNKDNKSLPTEEVILPVLRLTIKSINIELCNQVSRLYV